MLHLNNIEFVFFGDGALKNDLKEKYQHLDNVTIGPRIPKQAVPSALSMAQLTILATSNHHRWNYGQSLNKFIDYMMSGTPIYAIYSGFDNMLINNENGFISNSHDLQKVATDIEKISQLNPKTLSKIANEAQAWLVKERSYEKISKDYEDLINSIL